MKTLVIDVSKWQKEIDYTQIKVDGQVSGVILRCGYTGSAIKSYQADELFHQHAQGFQRVGIPIGVYWFSRATTKEEGKNEALATLGLIKDYRIDYPVYIDVEDNVYQSKVSRQALTDAVVSFCETIENAGYYVGIYASVSWFKDKLLTNPLEKFDKWVAHWGVDKPSYALPYGMHQYTSTGKVRGIAGDVDLNHCYKDYPMIMKVHGLNGYPKGDDIPPIPDADPCKQIKEWLELAHHHLEMASSFIELAKAFTPEDK
jgi:GH25 family lysozyme M1 (1,4-beta-N-acetylmuramidase)